MVYSYSYNLHLLVIRDTHVTVIIRVSAAVVLLFQKDHKGFETDAGGCDDDMVTLW